MPLTVYPVDQAPFAPARAADGSYLADQSLTVDNTSGGVSFTDYDPDFVSHVLLTVETAPCRFTLDGSAPTSTNGHPLYAGDVLTWPVMLFNAAKFIRTGGTSAVIHASPLRVSGGIPR